VELRRIQYFVAVAEEGHFGRAAARLSMAQPPLSQQIKLLEADMGVTLLERTTRKVQLTPAGRQFLHRAREILASMDAAVTEAGLVAEGRLGRVAIGFTGSATYELLPSLTRALSAQLPGLELDLRGEMLTPVQVTALLDGSLDLGFLRPPVGSADLDVRVLRRETLIAVLPEHHRLARRTRIKLADLRDEPFIMYPSHHRSVVHDAVIEACAQAGFTPARVQEVGETSTLVSFVAAGLGVALVPASVRNLRITGAQYLPLMGRQPEVELAIATRKDDASAHIERVRVLAEALVGGGHPIKS
jgi:DNA-binding transcriptional LysR family regulator